MRAAISRDFLLVLAPLLLALAGCGGVASAPSNADLTITPGSGQIDTNCTGCNAVNAAGSFVHQFSVQVAGGGATLVHWTVSGGDPASGTGTINASGQYSPPSSLSGDHAEVQVTATLDSGAKASALLTIAPGFLQPLSPENLSVGAGGSATLTGTLAEAGGEGEIQFALSASANGQEKLPSPDESGSFGTLSAARCQHNDSAFTTCSVTYTAPAAVTAASNLYVVATAGSSRSKTAAMILLNTAGVTSNPATHQGQVEPVARLGSSGGNIGDYDSQGGQIVDCCGGTLGALIEDATGRQFLLSNNHVLAVSDHASVGDRIVQPGLIDNNCNASGAGATPVASLTSWLPLESKNTQVDAAIAQVAERAVDSEGSILELGARQADGTLAAAAPGVRSTDGKGEAPALNLLVAKSGRTTGLTCSSITALDLDVSVDYFTDCAETRPYLTKSFSHQFAVSGNSFSDAGDSGSLVVDAASAEPVGLLFAGGVDAAGVSQAVVNPATEVLSELGAQAGTSFSFVGGNDHPVSCLNYGDNTAASAQARTLDAAEQARTRAALVEARALVNPAVGVLGAGTGKSNDHPGEGAVIFYVEDGAVANLPQTVAGVRTLVIPTTARALAAGTAPQSAPSGTTLQAGALTAAATVKQRVAAAMMQHNPVFFGVGIGQSLDNPKEAALIVYVDRKQPSVLMPATIDGLRIRYLRMDRMHVTRSYATRTSLRAHCLPHQAPKRFNPLEIFENLRLKLN